MGDQGCSSVEMVVKGKNHSPKPLGASGPIGSVTALPRNPRMSKSESVGPYILSHVSYRIQHQCSHALKVAAFLVAE